MTNCQRISWDYRACIMGAGSPSGRETFQTLYVVTKRKHFANPCFIRQFYSRDWLWRAASRQFFCKFFRQCFQRAALPRAVISRSALNGVCNYIPKLFRNLHERLPRGGVEQTRCCGCPSRNQSRPVAVQTRRNAFCVFTMRSICLLWRCVPWPMPLHDIT